MEDNVEDNVLISVINHLWRFIEGDLPSPVSAASWSDLTHLFPETESGFGKGSNPIPRMYRSFGIEKGSFQFLKHIPNSQSKSDLAWLSSLSSRHPKRESVTQSHVIPPTKMDQINHKSKWSHIGTSLHIGWYTESLFASFGTADESKIDVLVTRKESKSDNEVGPRLSRVKMRGNAANHMENSVA